MTLIIVATIARSYSSHYFSYHFARLSLFPSLSLRSAIAILIIITSLDHSHHYHSARLFSLLSLRSIIPIIITSLGYPHYHHFAWSSLLLSPSPLLSLRFLMGSNHSSNYSYSMAAIMIAIIVVIIVAIIAATIAIP